MFCCWVLQVGIIRGAPLLEQGTGTANTSLVFHAGRLLALHEGDLPYQVRTDGGLDSAITPSIFVYVCAC